MQAQSSVPSELPRFVTVLELAQLIKRNQFTIYHWLKEAPDKLPRVTRLYGRVLFLDSDVRTWFAGVCIDAPCASGPQSASVRRRGRPRKVASHIHAVSQA